ncbi:MAG TPA: cysteine dioxygenase family protein [Myxococcaceae bacterium]|nr:cysteine dioxygenase family protein [Myxococcaceae bacterium]
MSLPELQRLLGSLPPSRMRPEELRALAAGWPDALEVEELATRASFSDQGYTRTILHRSPFWEVLLVGWLRGQRTARHGHGESFGVTCVLEGSLIEVEYRLAPGGQVAKVERRKHGPGSVFHEEPHTIHHVAHTGRARAVSLHLYAPPLQRMELYDGSTGTSQPRRSGRREPKSSIMAR